jgi:hypothetical protein
MSFGDSSSSRPLIKKMPSPHALRCHDGLFTILNDDLLSHQSFMVLSFFYENSTEFQK